MEQFSYYSSTQKQCKSAQIFFQNTMYLANLKQISTHKKTVSCSFFPNATVRFSWLPVTIKSSYTQRQSSKKLHNLAQNYTIQQILHIPTQFCTLQHNSALSDTILHYPTQFCTFWYNSTHSSARSRQFEARVAGDRVPHLLPQRAFLLIVGQL